jgi:exosortase/archaeosortase family protein
MIDIKKISPGLKSFLIKTIVFVAVALGLRILINHYPGEAPWIRATYLGSAGNPTGYKPYELMSVIKAAIFIIIAFVMFNWKKIARFKKYPVKTSDIALFSALSVGFYFLHYLFKYFLKLNPDLAASFFFLFFFVKIFLIFLCLLCLALAVFGWAFFVDFIRDFRLQIPLVLGLGAAFYFLIDLASRLWYVSSSAVTYLVAKMLSLHVPDVWYRFATDAPILYAKAKNVMYVNIAKECSGIDGFLLFTSIFFIIMYLERDHIDKRKMLLSFVPGAVIFFFYNVLRIYLLMVVGIYISESFALDLFHDNIGWVLFLIYFVVFWHFASKYVYLKKPEGKVRKKAKTATSKKKKFRK